jgi:DNA-directed RNA polymerase specialized sigma24 family protein
MMQQRHSKHDVVCEVFCSHLQQLHLEAYALTGCPELAADCVLEAFAAMRSCYLASPDFAYKAAKLATIKSSLRKIAPEVLRHCGSDSKRKVGGAGQKTISLNAWSDTIVRERFLISLLRLNAFYRALLVLRLYERYRIYDVALLLRLPPARIKCWLPNAISALVASIQDSDGKGA